MIVEILKSCKQTGIRKGQVYKAKRYALDPSKVTLLKRIKKKDGSEMGKDPMCNEYVSNVRILTDSPFLNGSDLRCPK